MNVYYQSHIRSKNYQKKNENLFYRIPKLTPTQPQINPPQSSFDVAFLCTEQESFDENSKTRIFFPIYRDNFVFFSHLTKNESKTNLYNLKEMKKIWQ